MFESNFVGYKANKSNLLAFDEFVGQDIHKLQTPQAERQIDNAKTLPYPHVFAITMIGLLDLTRLSQLVNVGDQILINSQY